MLTTALLTALALAEHRPAPVYTIDLDLPPEKRFDVLLDPATGINATVWEFWNDYFAKDRLLTDVLFALVSARGDETAEMMAEIRGLSDGTKLPLKFVQGIQMLYELQTIMVPIINLTGLPSGVGSTLNYTFHEALPQGLEALARMPVGPGCTGIIATNRLDKSVSHVRRVGFEPTRPQPCKT